MYVKYCKVCAERFNSATQARTTCSEECRKILKYKSIKSTYSKKTNKPQPCESCQRATGLVINKIVCPWARCLKPVQGWDANPIVIDDAGKSYDIISCPLYLQDEPRRKRR